MQHYTPEALDTAEYHDIQTEAFNLEESVETLTDHEIGTSADSQGPVSGLGDSSKPKLDKKSSIRMAMESVTAFTSVDLTNFDDDVVGSDHDGDPTLKVRQRS